VRTTVDIPDYLYRRLKSRAAEEGSSIRKLILRDVEQVLHDKRRKPRHQRVKLPLVRCNRPSTVHLDNAHIYDIISFP
jgi:hypothetical protein